MKALVEWVTLLYLCYYLLTCTFLYRYDIIYDIAWSCLLLLLLSWIKVLLTLMTSLYSLFHLIHCTKIVFFLCFTLRLNMNLYVYLCKLYTSGPVSTWMGDHPWMGKPSRYITSHPGQLSLAIPPWVGAMSTSESWGVNRHTARYTSPIYPWSRSVSWWLAEG